MAATSLFKTGTLAFLIGNMKNTFLDQEKDLRHYLTLAIAEASDQEARAIERDWIMDDDPPTQTLQDIAFRIYHYPRPLTKENFLDILKTLKA